jgi:hypothetical protein
MDATDPDKLSPDEEQAETDEQPSAGEPRFPVIILAAPGCIFTLFVVMVDALAASLRSVGLAIVVATAATIGAIACFAVIAAKSPERHVKIGAAIGIGLVLFSFAVAILRLT